MHWRQEDREIAFLARLHRLRRGGRRRKDTEGEEGANHRQRGHVASEKRYSTSAKESTAKT